MSLTSTSESKVGTQGTTTTLPSWFSTAQENAATSAGNALASAQAPANQTVGANLISSYGGATNPFATTQSNLGQIQSGLLGTYNPDGTLNQQSPLGALFAAQNAKLDQILPQITAKEGAVGLGLGGYGSLRGQTATGAARAGALTTLAADQRKAALDAYGQAIQAANVAGNVGSQAVTSGLNMARYQTESPLDVMAKYENILGALGPTLNKTTTQTTDETTTRQGSAIENIQKGATFLAQIGYTGKALYDKLTAMFPGEVIPPEYADPSGGMDSSTATGPAIDYTNTPPETYSPDNSSITNQDNYWYE